MLRIPKITIVGAGVSGIAAARKLIENGFTDVTILEASNRLGGRIKSVDFAGSVVELGAQWCHGETNNIVYELVKDLNLLEASFNTYRDNIFYDSRGRRIDKALTDQLFQVFVEITDELEYSNDIRGSFGEHFIKRYNERDTSKFGEVMSSMLDWFHKFILCYESSPTWFDLSVGGRDCFEQCDGNQLLHWRNEGFKTIVDVLMNRYSIDVLFNKEVCKVNWNGRQSETNQIIVDCVDNTSYKADHVIITASLGVLKERYKSLFVPDLPEYKRHAIEGLSMGTVVKVFVKFPSKWWPNNCPGFSLLWRASDAVDVFNEFPYGPSRNGRSWLEDVFGFYVVDSDPKTLLGWIVGEHAPEVESLPKEILLNGCDYLLNKFLGKMYDIPKPESILRSKWYSDPLFRGTYSYRNVRSDSGSDELAEPIPSTGKPRLLFAGEATHSKYFSTVHGAIESGFREAERIINTYTNANVTKYTVAIVGAGMAGLGAARALLESGLTDVIILEAQNAVGGRIKTIETDDGILELGAQWLHGTDNSLFQMAETNGLILPDKSYEGLGTYVRDDGYVFDDRFVKNVHSEIGRILEACEKFTDADTYPTSFGDYLEEKYRSLLDRSNLDEATKEMKWELYDWHVRFHLIDNSCKDLKKVSAKDWGKYSCLAENGQEYVNIKNGYKSLVDFIVKSLPGGIFRLNSPVLKIDYAENDIKLTCKDGSITSADHVIVTTSIGVLQQDVIRFQPPLPSIISGAISNLGFHGIGKVFLLFDKKWWNSDGFQLIWRRNNVETKWTRYITGFDVVLNQPSTLLAWIGGDGVEAMEKLSEDVVGIECVNLLRAFLKNRNIPHPVKVYRSSWTSCPWVRGGYSYTTPASDPSGLGPSALTTPVVIDGVPKVLFAGEAAHPNHFSTTHGAFESGQQQASVLAKFYRRSKL